MATPGARIGKSSSAVVDVLEDPGFRIGNSSSSGLLGIGIGAEMVPRMDLCRVLARPAVEPDFPKMLGMAGGVGGCKLEGDGDERMEDGREVGGGRTGVVDKGYRPLGAIDAPPTQRTSPAAVQCKRTESSGSSR
jgi:hypothetical protein